MHISPLLVFQRTYTTSLLQLFSKRFSLRRNTSVASDYFFVAENFPLLRYKEGETRARQVSQSEQFLACERANFLNLRPPEMLTNIGNMFNCVYLCYVYTRFVNTSFQLLRVCRQQTQVCKLVQKDLLLRCPCSDKLPLRYVHITFINF